MRVEFINPFIVSTKQTFETMLGWELERSNVFAMNDIQLQDGVTGVIDLTGGATGKVALTLSRTLGFEVTQEILMEETPDARQMADAVGELTNIVAGNAKAELDHYSIRISTPQVQIGGAKRTEFEGASLCIEFESPRGPVTLQVGLAVNAPAGAMPSLREGPKSDTPILSALSLDNHQGGRWEPLTKDQTLAEAAEVMLASQLGSLPVVDDEKNLIGMLSEYDLLNLLYGADLREMRVADHMTTDIAFAEEYQPLGEVADIFLNNTVQRIPVVRKGRLMGMIHRHDLLKHAFATQAMSESGNDIL
ncbi:MAG: CBS domain-containing protein [Pirellulaceae bacterium]|jgi:chemotaxis protein CheX|nr:CBS domain-containing protein [Pirellulaceae bacterium]MDP7016655.1 CBS domain-containing protein [Pirellulaceae bacterium]